MSDAPLRLPLGEHAPLMTLVEAVADRAAQKAADSAVHATFRLLGVDLDDEASVRATRDSMTAMRDRWESRRDRAVTWRRAQTHGVVGIISIAIVGLWSLIWHR